jgi:hypothetical protein
LEFEASKIVDPETAYVATATRRGVQYQIYRDGVIGLRKYATNNVDAQGHVAWS